MLECSLEVPNTWPLGKERDLSPYDYFAEMSPLFCTSEISHEDIGEFMTKFCQDSGIKLVNITCYTICRYYVLYLLVLCFVTK